MFKKSVIICLSLGCLNVLADAKFEFRNPSSYQYTLDTLDNLQKEIKIYAGNNQITNAQQMYDFVTKVRESEHNPYTLSLFDVMRSFLRRQDNHMKLEQLMSKTDKLIAALKWMNTAKNQNNDISFYDKTDHIATLMNPEYFIHLTKEQMQFCLKFTKKMKETMDINSISDDTSAEDGVALTATMFEKERDDAQLVLNALTDLEKKILAFGEKIDSLSKEDLTKRIEEFAKLIGTFKKIEITIGGKQIIISKNMIRHLRMISGAVMNQLQEKRNKFPSE